MASYAFATLQARQKLQELWEQGTAVKDLSTALEVPLSTLYTELRRGPLRGPPPRPTIAI